MAKAFFPRPEMWRFRRPLPPRPLIQAGAAEAVFVGQSGGGRAHRPERRGPLLQAGAAGAHFFFLSRGSGCVTRVPKRRVFFLSKAGGAVAFLCRPERPGAEIATMKKLKGCQWGRQGAETGPLEKKSRAAGGGVAETATLEKSSNCSTGGEGGRNRTTGKLASCRWGGREC